MKKCILFVRVSTTAQDFTEQLAELKEFAKSYGYSRFTIIEGAGASAIKLNDLYLDMIGKVQTAILEDSAIDCVFLWALDRFGRDDAILINMKNWFIKNKINLIIKNPTLVLLNPDKTVNAGTEITYNVLAAVAKQEMQAKFARFERTRKAKKKANLYNGGEVLMGYYVDKDKKYAIDPDNIILEIFTKYSTGMYSQQELAKEFQSRGYWSELTLVRATKAIARILNNAAYTGQPSKKGVRYPPIISEELFRECRALGNSKAFFTQKKLNDKSILLRGIIQCEDGHSMCKSSGRYVCVYDHRSIMMDITDAAVWYASIPIYANFCSHELEDQKKEVIENTILLKKKIQVSEGKIAESNSRLEALDEAIYVTGKVKVDRGEKLKEQLLLKIKEEEKNITSYKEQIASINIIPTSENFINLDEIAKISDPETKFDIVHKVVAKVVPVRITKNIQELHITYYFGHTSVYKVNTYSKKIEIEDGKWIDIKKEQPN